MAYRFIPKAFIGQLFILLVLLFWPGCKTMQDQKTVEFNPVAEVLLRQGTQSLRQHAFGPALALADSAEKLTPNSANVHFLRARIYSELGQWEKAETAYRQVLKLQPDYRGVWNNLGNNAFRQQEYYQAITYYEKELKRHPAPIPLRGMGRAYVELGKVDSALHAFQRAIAIDSLYAPGYLSLTLLIEDEGEFEKALGYAKRALHLDPENLEYRYLVGSLLLRTNQSGEAISHLRIVLEKWPWHRGAHYNLGQSLVRLGQEDQAKKYLEEAERLRALDAKIEHLENTVRALPNAQYAHAALGFALRRARRYNDAMHAYKVAHFLAPQNVEIRNNIANLCLIRGDTTKAINHYRAILRDDPTLLDIWLNLGVVYALSNEVKAARQAWQNVLKYEPKHPAAKAYLSRLEDTQQNIDIQLKGAGRQIPD